MVEVVTTVFAAIAVLKGIFKFFRWIKKWLKRRAREAYLINRGQINWVEGYLHDRPDNYVRSQEAQKRIRNLQLQKESRNWVLAAEDAEAHAEDEEDYKSDISVVSDCETLEASDLSDNEDEDDEDNNYPDEDESQDDDDEEDEEDAIYYDSDSD